MFSSGQSLSNLLHLVLIFFILFNQRDLNAQRIFRFVFKANPDCKCSRGLACKVTREMFLDGHKVQVKQCMSVNERVVVEQLTEDDVRETLDPGSTAVEQTSTFYPGKVRYCRAARFK